MKSFTVKKLNLILLVFFIWGCSKNQLGDSMDEVETGRVGLNVRVDGIIEDFGNYTYANVPVHKQDNSNFNSEILNFNDFDAITSVENLAIKPNHLSFKNGNHKLASSLPMAQNVYYYLVLYENQNNSPGSFVSKSLMQVGVAKTIYVQTGVSYYWVAYSYNSIENNLPTVTSDNSIIDLGIGKDVLYAKGVTPVIQPDVATYLPIVFNHKMARVGIEINTRGLFADIESAEIELGGDYFMSGNLNIKTDIITPSTSGYGDGVKVNSFSNVPNESSQDRKVAFFYTASTSAISNLTVKLNNLNIKLDAEAVALGNSNREFTYTTSPPTFVANSFAPLSNSTKVFKIDLVESPIVVTSKAKALLGVVSLGEFDVTTRWARSNVYKHTNNSYRFQHINTLSDKRSSYFSWGSVDPINYGIGYNISNPCGEVYPKGVWRMATSTDFQILLGGEITGSLLGLVYVDLPVVGSLLNALGLVNKVEFPGIAQTRTNKYIEYANSSIPNVFYKVQPHALIDDVEINNKLRFNFNGYFANIGLVEDLVTLNLGSTYGLNTRVWTSSAAASLPLLGTAVGAMQFQGTNSNSQLVAALLNVTALGINVAKTDLQNIRCVRAN